MFDEPQDESSTVQPAAEAVDRTSADPAATEGGEDRVATLTKERDELYDRLLRSTAEFDNYRKRTDRERRETSERVTAAVLEEVLPVIDDFERALGAPPDASADVIRAGLEIIYKQFQDVLARRGVTAIAAVGEDFDPHVHQAVAYDESPGHREGEVVEEMRRGYKLGDRLLRPAMVRVAKA